jgi:hypothetical protein
MLAASVRLWVCAGGGGFVQSLLVQTSLGGPCATFAILAASSVMAVLLVVPGVASAEGII